MLKYILIFVIVAAAFWAGSMMDTLKGSGGFTDKACKSVKERIETKTTNLNNESDIGQLRDLNRIFTRNCRHRDIKISTEARKNKKVLSERTCEAIEDLILQRREFDDEWSMDPWIRVYVAKSYADLSFHGCPENREKFRQLALREVEIAEVLFKVENMEALGDQQVQQLYRYLGPQ